MDRAPPLDSYIKLRTMDGQSANGSIVVYLMRCRTNVELAERTDGCLRISDCRNSV